MECARVGPVLAHEDDGFVHGARAARGQLLAFALGLLDVGLEVAGIRGKSQLFVRELVALILDERGQLLERLGVQNTLGDFDGCRRRDKLLQAGQQGAVLGDEIALLVVRRLLVGDGLDAGIDFADLIACVLHHRPLTETDRANLDIVRALRVQALRPDLDGQVRDDDFPQRPRGIIQRWAGGTSTRRVTRAWPR